MYLDVYFFSLFFKSNFFRTFSTLFSDLFIIIKSFIYIFLIDIMNTLRMETIMDVIEIPKREMNKFNILPNNVMGK